MSSKINVSVYDFTGKLVLIALTNENVTEGKNEFKKLYQERSIERAMSEIPHTIKEIRQTAVESVFSKELAQLSEQDRELVDKIISYMEKKYISVPMKLAKSVLLEEVQKH